MIENKLFKIIKRVRITHTLLIEPNGLSNRGFNQIHRNRQSTESPLNPLKLLIHLVQ